MRVDTLLTDLLRATADKAAASRRVDLLRDRLDTEARRRLAEEGAAPSWKAPSLGTVRLDPKPAKAYVEDGDAFASYVAERFPSEVTARLELAATELEAALEALEFAGVTVLRSAVEVRPTFAEALLGNAEVLYDDSDPANVVKVAARVVDGDQLEAIEGAGVLPPSATLVVSLDRTAKARVLAGVEEALEQELEAADPAPVALEYLGDELGTVTSPVEERRLLAEQHAATVGERLIAQAEAGRDADAADRRTEADAGDAAYAATVAVTPELVAAQALDEADDDAVSLGVPDPTTYADVAAGVAPLLDPVAAEATVVVDDAPTPGSRPAGAPPYTARPGFAFAPSPGDPGYDLMPEARPAAAPEASSSDPGNDPVARLAVLPTDDLKRAARRHRLPISGTKVILAAKLHRAGVTVDDVVALRPAE